MHVRCDLDKLLLFHISMTSLCELRLLMAGQLFAICRRPDSDACFSVQHVVDSVDEMLGCSMLLFQLCQRFLSSLLISRLLLPIPRLMVVLSSAPAVIRSSRRSSRMSSGSMRARLDVGQEDPKSSELFIRSQFHTMERRLHTQASPSH